jgi:rhamnogalacturonyl hydrolase YesR
MIPPFLAAYGVVTQNRSLITESYNQIKLYRNYLRDSAGGGTLWRHIVLGSFNDSTHWSTGELGLSFSPHLILFTHLPIHPKATPGLQLE